MKDAQAREDIERLEQSVADVHQRLDTFTQSMADLERAVAAATTRRIDPLTVEITGLQEQIQVLAMENNAIRVDMSALMTAVKSQSEHLAGLISGMQAAVTQFVITPTEPQPDMLPIGVSETSVRASMSRDQRRRIDRQSRRSG